MWLLNYKRVYLPKFHFQTSEYRNCNLSLDIPEIQKQEEAEIEAEKKKKELEEGLSKNDYIKLMDFRVIWVQKTFPN